MLIDINKVYQQKAGYDRPKMEKRSQFFQMLVTLMLVNQCTGNGRLDEALRHNKDALDHVQRCFGNAHPCTQRMVFDIGRVHLQKAEYDKPKSKWNCFGMSFKQWPHSVSKKYGER